MQRLSRDNSLDELTQQPFDVVIVGAGINGAVTAAALAKAGARVALIDQGDFAQGASSGSSNLIWGGIKYMETHEYGLVNKLCQCRNRLLKLRPSMVSEIRFLTTIQKGFRFPAMMIFAGSLLYWVIGRFATRMPKFLRRRDIVSREPVIDADSASGGVEYSDCHLRDGDARLVLRWVSDCQRSGGVVANYVSAVAGRRGNDGWTLDLSDSRSDWRGTLKAKVLVNACGPQVDQFNQSIGVKTRTRHLLSKGVHLVVPRLVREHRILAFFASDGRLFFISPMGSQSCIGTTDTRVDDPNVVVDNEDRDFILANANSLLNLTQPLTRDDIISERIGVRPLAVESSGEASDDWLAMSRKHIIETQTEQTQISIFGGKLTDCLNVAEEVAAEVAALGVDLTPLADEWCAEPVGEVKREFRRWVDEAGLDQLADDGVQEPLSSRLWRRYETDAIRIGKAIAAEPTKASRLMSDSDYCRAELDYALEYENAVTAEDVLRRRSDLLAVCGQASLQAAGIIDEIEQRLSDVERKPASTERRASAPTA